MRRRVPSAPSKRAIAMHLAALAGDFAEVAELKSQQRKPRAKQKAPEREVLKAIQEYTRLTGVTAFRNNTGQYEAAPGRWVRYGLCVGSSDLIGYRTLTIGPEHIGRRIAQFVAIECKAPGKNATPEQQEFIFKVRLAGGVAGVARGIDDVQEMLK
jgi:hypothetical protein